jgi:hypothetical protein
MRSDFKRLLVDQRLECKMFNKKVSPLSLFLSNPSLLTHTNKMRDILKAWPNNQPSPTNIGTNLFPKLPLHYVLIPNTHRDKMVKFFFVDPVNPISS